MNELDIIITAACLIAASLYLIKVFKPKSGSGCGCGSGNCKIAKPELKKD